MNIYVLVKQVPDTETKIRITADKTNIEKGEIKWIINPYDEFAIEEAIKIREKLKTGTVTVVSAGPDRVVEALRTAVAMGADNAIHLKIDQEADSALVSKALAAAVRKDTVDLILTGKQAIDDDQCVVFGYVAELLNLPSSSVVVKVDFAADNKSIKVEREVEGGTKHIIDMPLPAVLGINKGINTPRYASLPGIMKAKKKEIKVMSLADLGVGTDNATKDLNYQLPPERPPGKKIAGDAATQAKELVRLLREEAKII